MAMKRESFQISGKAFWSMLYRPDETGRYTMNLSLDEESKKVLEDGGVKLRVEGDSKLSEDPKKWVGTENDRGTYVTLRSKYPPTVADARGKEIKTPLNVGNGSRINANVHLYQGKKGTSVGFNGVQIISLVAYESKKSVTFAPTEGFTFEEPEVSEVKDRDTECPF